jgi:HK97 family phage prohead protease
MRDALLFRRTGRPASLDAAARTIEVVAATSAPIPMASRAPDGTGERWFEILDMTGADLARLIDGPVLEDHDASARRVVGRVTAARVAGDRLLAAIKISAAVDVEPVWQRIADGTLSTVSVGYRVHRYEQDKARPRTWIARAWQPLEISFVAIPADPRARVRGAAPSLMDAKEIPHMEQNTTPAELPAAVRAERERIAAIDVAVEAARALLPAERIAAVRAEAIAQGWTGDAVRRALFDALVAHGPRPSVPARPETGPAHDDPAAIRDAMADAIAARAMPGYKPKGDGRHVEFMGASITDMARELLLARGERVDRRAPAHKLLERSMLVVSDLPALLASAGQRILAQLLAADSPARSLCRPRQVRDFRQIEAIAFGGPGRLEQLLEGGEVTISPPAERREVGRVRTYARQLHVSRESLINDDLGAFAEPLRLFAAAVAETEAAEFLRLFATNGSGWGPNMADGQPLFHASHANVVTATMGTAGIGEARRVMRLQQLPGGGLARVTPRHLLTGSEQETLAEQTLSALAVATAEDDRPVFANRLVLHVEPRLPGPAWFLFADPNEAAIAEFVTLERTGGVPQVESFDLGPNRLGISLRCIHDFAVIPTGYVGAVRATGTAP